MSSERIEGLPIGVRIARVLRRRFSGPEEAIVMLEPANDYGVLDLSMVPIPEGYERDGNSPEEWFRRPRINERYIHPDRGPVVAENNYDLDLPPRIIVRPIKKTKRVLVVEVDEKDRAGEFCDARFCDIPSWASAIKLSGNHKNGREYRELALCNIRCRIEERDE